MESDVYLYNYWYLFKDLHTLTFSERNGQFSLYSKDIWIRRFWTNTKWHRLLYHISRDCCSTCEYTQRNPSFPTKSCTMRRKHKEVPHYPGGPHSPTDTWLTLAEPKVSVTLIPKSGTARDPQPVLSTSHPDYIERPAMNRRFTLTVYSEVSDGFIGRNPSRPSSSPALERHLHSCAAVYTDNASRTNICDVPRGSQQAVSSLNVTSLWSTGLLNRPTLETPGFRNMTPCRFCISYWLYSDFRTQIVLRTSLEFLLRGSANLRLTFDWYSCLCRWRNEMTGFGASGRHTEHLACWDCSKWPRDKNKLTGLTAWAQLWRANGMC